MGYSTERIELVKEYVLNLLAEKFSDLFTYHNIDHTLEVVEAAELIGINCGIGSTDLELLIIAAWFHDTGYYLGCENHEKASAEIAFEFMEKQQWPASDIELISRCILATKIPQSPETQLEKILCDADLYHIASVRFFEKTELLWQEISHFDVNRKKTDWTGQNKHFLETHRFHTKYGREILDPQRKKNLEVLNSQLRSG